MFLKQLTDSDTYLFYMSYGYCFFFPSKCQGSMCVYIYQFSKLFTAASYIAKMIWYLNNKVAHANSMFFFDKIH